MKYHYYSKRWASTVVETLTRIIHSNHHLFFFFFFFLVQNYLVCVWEARFVLPTSTFCIFFSSSRDCWLWGVNSAHTVTFLATFQSRDPQTSLFSNFIIKSGSHSTIHTFKNYFTTVFFNFQFSTVSKLTFTQTIKLNIKPSLR